MPSLLKSYKKLLIPKGCFASPRRLVLLSAGLHSYSQPPQHNEMPPLAEQYFYSLDFSPLKATFLPLGRVCKISSKSMLK